MSGATEGLGDVTLPSEATACAETPPVDASVLLDRAQQLWDSDDFDRSLVAAEEARAAAIRLDMASLQVRASCIAGSSRLWLGDTAGAAREIVLAKAVAQDAGLVDLLADAQVYSAMLSNAIGDPEQAQAELEPAWHILSAGHDLAALLRCQRTFSRSFCLLGNYETARGWLTQARDTALQAGLGILAARSAVDLAGTWLDEGDSLRDRGAPGGAHAAWTNSVSAAEAALGLGESLLERGSRIVLLVNLASALNQLGEFGGALQRLDQAVQVMDAGVHILSYELAQGVERARVLRHLGDLDAAEELLRKNHDAAEQAGLLHELEGVYKLWSEIAELRGDDRQALLQFRRYHVLGERIRGDKARLRSQVLAARHETERAQAEARALRDQARLLAMANESLTADAASLREQAMIDPLTGLANRRDLDNRMSIGHAEALARSVPLCAAIFDIDHFKQVNDRFSHGVGDAVIREVARILKTQSRSNDVVARYGGEEFVILFADIGLRTAAKTCERIRRAVQAHAWDAVAPALAVTLSGGVADIAEDPDPAHGLGRADRLLYEAKSAGRNRIVC